MAVNTSDEYLDELLQSIEPIINPESLRTETEVATPVQQETNEDVVMTEMEIGAEVELMPEMEIGAEVELMPEMEIGAEVDVMPEIEIGAEMELTPDIGGSVETDVNIGADLFSGLEDSTSEFTALESMPTNDMNDMSESDLMAMLLADGVLQDSIEEEEVEIDSVPMELAMSEEEIDALLSSAKERATESNSDASNEEVVSDVSELLKQFSDDEDINDIQDILQKDEQGEVIDESIAHMLDDVGDDVAEAVIDDEKTPKKPGIIARIKMAFAKKKSKETEDMSGNSDNADVSNGLDVSHGESSATDDLVDIDQLLSNGTLLGDGEGSESNLEDGSDKSNKKNKAKKEKKESIFIRIFNLLTEEEEPEEKKVQIPEATETGITEENQAILEELSKEEKKKPKKEKKSKKKKGKDKDEASENSDSEESEEMDEKAKKKKEKKEKREKKKAQKYEVIDKPQKKLSKKRVISIFALCFSIMAFILIMLAVIPGISNVKEARWAFDNADYETCYMNLYGEERSETDELIFRKSEVILRVERSLNSYHNLKQLGMEVEALDALLEGVRTYREVESTATELGVLNRIEPYYEELISNLEGYGVTQDDMEEIFTYESKVAYTLRLKSIINGTPFEWQGLGEEDINDSNN